MHHQEIQRPTQVKMCPSCLSRGNVIVTTGRVATLFDEVFQINTLLSETVETWVFEVDTFTAVPIFDEFRLEVAAEPQSRTPTQRSFGGQGFVPATTTVRINDECRDVRECEPPQSQLAMSSPQSSMFCPTTIVDVCFVENKENVPVVAARGQAPFTGMYCDGSFDQRALAQIPFHQPEDVGEEVESANEFESENLAQQLEDRIWASGNPMYEFQIYRDP